MYSVHCVAFITLSPTFSSKFIRAIHLEERVMKTEILLFSLDYDIGSTSRGHTRCFF